MHDGLVTEETEETRQLRREVKRLREEREILVQAAALHRDPVLNPPPNRTNFTFLPLLRWHRCKAP
jgi:transposase-like protein